jgi:hypothetical protein
MYVVCATLRVHLCSQCYKFMTGRFCGCCRHCTGFKVWEYNVVFETSSKILVDVISLRTVKISEFNDNVTSITSILDLNFNSGARFI